MATQLIRLQLTTYTYYRSSIIAHHIKLKSHVVTKPGKYGLGWTPKWEIGRME